MADLKGKVALVTDVSGESGAGIAQGLAEAGATIYLTGRSSSQRPPQESSTLAETAAHVDQLGGQGIVHGFDLNDDAALAALFERIAREQGRLDLLVNNSEQFAHDEPGNVPFWQQPESVFDDLCAVPLRRAYVTAVAAAKMMVVAKGGLIVNVSCGGARAYARNIVWGVAEVGLDRMASVVAQELSSHQVTAMALHPGLIATPDVLAGIADGTLQADLAGVQSPRFIGRCIAALAMDPDIAEKAGGSYSVATLAAEYRFSDPGQQQEP